jgi:hypothetical protein
MKISMLLWGGTALSAALAMAQEPVPTETFEQRVVITRTDGPAHEGGPVTADFVAFSTGMNPLAPVVKNAPYSADAVSETVQTLPDGNRISHQNSSQLARDGQGRTMRREKLGAVGPVSAASPAEITFINDPVANVNWVLEGQTKTARKMTVTATQSAGTSHATIGGIVGGSQTSDVFYERVENGMTQYSKFSKPPARNDKSEPLGKRTIEGLECDGTKSTLTIPAGQIGNERPIEIVSERWYSPELQTVVYSKRSDPRMGETTYKLTNIVRSEPSRALFEVPADYTVKESMVKTGVKKKD